MQYNQSKGEEVTISIGGLGGQKGWLEDKNESRYFSTTNFEVMPALGIGFNGGIGVGLNFNSGRFYPIDKEFALFLKEILVEQKIEAN